MSSSASASRNSSYERAWRYYWYLRVALGFAMLMVGGWAGDDGITKSSSLLLSASLMMTGVCTIQSALTTAVGSGPCQDMTTPFLCRIKSSSSSGGWNLLSHPRRRSLMRFAVGSLSLFAVWTLLVEKTHALVEQRAVVASSTISGALVTSSSAREDEGSATEDDGGGSRLMTVEWVLLVGSVFSSCIWQILFCRKMKKALPLRAGGTGHITNIVLNGFRSLLDCVLMDIAVAASLLTGIGVWLSAQQQIDVHSVDLMMAMIIGIWLSSRTVRQIQPAIDLLGNGDPTVNCGGGPLRRALQNIRGELLLIHGVLQVLQLRTLALEAIRDDNSISTTEATISNDRGFAASLTAYLRSLLAAGDLHQVACPQVALFVEVRTSGTYPYSKARHPNLAVNVAREAKEIISRYQPLIVCSFVEVVEDEHQKTSSLMQDNVPSSVHASSSCCDHHDHHPI